MIESMKKQKKIINFVQMKTNVFRMTMVICMMYTIIIIKIKKKKIKKKIVLIIKFITSIKFWFLMNVHSMELVERLMILEIYSVENKPL